MADNRVNFLLITIDCWREDHLENTALVPSPVPHIAKFADESTVFRQAITGGGWTRPSLTALFSSTYPSMYGGALNAYATTRPMLTEQLKALNYETAGFTTNPQVGTAFGFHRGFDTFIDSIPKDPTSKLRIDHVKGGQRLLCKPITHALLRPFGFQTLPPEITTPAEQLSQIIGTWMSGPHDRPFFLWAHYMDAHWPYHVLSQMKNPRDIAYAWRDLQAMYRVSLEHGKLSPGDEQENRLKQLYREALGYIDESIGRLLDQMNNSGLLNNTVVILTSDHGEEFYEHGRWGHYQLFDESLHVPLIMHLPGMNSQAIDRQVSLLDITPTILSLAGATPLDGMYGHNLLDSSSGSLAEEIAYAESMWPNVYRMAIRTPAYKYIFDNSRNEGAALYDIQEDPEEINNIYYRHSKVARQFDDLRQEQELRAEASYTSGKAAGNLDPTLSYRLKSLGYIE